MFKSRVAFQRSVDYDVHLWNRERETSLSAKGSFRFKEDDNHCSSSLCFDRIQCAHRTASTQKEPTSKPTKPCDVHDACVHPLHLLDARQAERKKWSYVEELKRCWGWRWRGQWGGGWRILNNNGEEAEIRRQMTRNNLSNLNIRNKEQQRS